MGIFRAVALAIALTLPVLQTPRAAAEPNDAAKTKSRIETLLGRAQRLRAATPAERSTVLASVVVLGPEELSKRLAERSRSDALVKRLSQRVRALQCLGLVSSDFAFASWRDKQIAQSALGFFDASSGELVAGLRDEDSELVRSLTHALRHQRRNLEEFLGEADGADARLAREAVLEGDGFAAMVEFRLAASGHAPPWGNASVVETFAAAVSLGRRETPFEDGLLFPYRAGLRFVADLRKHRGWNAVDDLYEKPPLSTEHILHAERYRAYEVPTRIVPTMPSALVGAREDVVTVVGEYGVRTFLRGHGLPTARSFAAAAGWGGDTLVVYDSGVTGALPIGVWLTSWDSEQDAEEFTTALEFALGGFAGGSATRVRQLIRATGKRGAVAERRGREVLLLLGATRDGGDAIREDVWRRWSRRSP